MTSNVGGAVKAVIAAVGGPFPSHLKPAADKMWQWETRYLNDTNAIVVAGRG